jgi:hypothetical protein
MSHILMAEKTQMHILIGKSNAIKFLGCIIFQTRDVSTLFLLSFLVMPLIGGIKYKRISMCWDVIISTHGMR